MDGMIDVIASQVFIGNPDRRNDSLARVTT